MNKTQELVDISQHLYNLSKQYYISNQQDFIAITDIVKQTRLIETLLVAQLRLTRSKMTYNENILLTKLMADTRKAKTKPYTREIQADYNL